MFWYIFNSRTSATFVHLVYWLISFHIVYYYLYSYDFRFVSSETIEERILKLQTEKLDLANSVLTGSKQTNKLSLDDLKSLFQITWLISLLQSFGCELCCYSRFYCYFMFYNSFYYNLPIWDYTNFVIYSFPIHQYNLVNVDIRSQLVYF